MAAVPRDLPVDWQSLEGGVTLLDQLGLPPIWLSQATPSVRDSVGKQYPRRDPTQRKGVEG